MESADELMADKLGSSTSSARKAEDQREQEKEGEGIEESQRIVAVIDCSSTLGVEGPGAKYQQSRHGYGCVAGWPGTGVDQLKDQGPKALTDVE